MEAGIAITKRLQKCPGRSVPTPTKNKPKPNQQKIFFTIHLPPATLLPAIPDQPIVGEFAKRDDQQQKKKAAGLVGIPAG